MRWAGTSSILALTASCLLLGAQPAVADSSDNIETVVVTGTQFNPDVAPAKASLDTMQPQTIINRSYIEDSVPATSDYVTVLAIVPSLTGTDINGPGMSEGSVKNTLRGLPDGNFGMTYDGIPFGDTNGPSHHSESYFPGSTIGSIDVDRGPGNAGTLGAATYGGTINMFSEALTDDRRIRQTATLGSWNTWNVNTNVQSGDIDGLGGQTRLLANFQVTGSAGYLTHQSSLHSNELLKVEHEIAPGWTLTALATVNALHEALSDNNGATAAQVTTYGKAYAMQNTTSQSLGTYNGYNHTDKVTDMEYVRLQGTAGDGFSVDDTAYMYAYVNKTTSATNIEQTSADIANGVTEGLGTTVGGVKFKTDVPGYEKLNEYRVYGNILRVSKDYDLGSITGQIRTGIWWEVSNTQRARFDYDMTKCLAAGCNVFSGNSAFWDSTNAAKGKAVLLTNQRNAAYNGYAEYLEHSGWQQYEPFLEVDIKPFDGLTLTPGVKYINWVHETNAPVEPKLLQPYSGKFTTTQTLPFAEANYKIEQSWSVYAQYAQGIYVPDIGVFEQKSPVNAFPAAELTTNYQFGSVYYADNFTIDGDVYYIGIDNNYVSENCSLVGGPSGDLCFVNTGNATYKGVEGETTYAFNGDVFDGALDGLAIFVNGSLMSSKSKGKWVKQAPMWTAAGGLIYKAHDWKLSLIDKLVGQQYSDNADSTFYKLGAYNNMDFTGSYTIGRLEIGGGVYNVLDSRHIVSLSENDSTPIGGTSAQQLLLRGGSLDQYFFQPERSFQITLKARF
ncbi:MAG: TonB-dependent receptor [Alphaproteobacteria bacterium]|nr:TonB-dependent receptor [Alphaproteobacteria bacterium]